VTKRPGFAYAVNFFSSSTGFPFCHGVGCLGPSQGGKGASVSRRARPCCSGAGTAVPGSQKIPAALNMGLVGGMGKIDQGTKEAGQKSAPRLGVTKDGRPATRKKTRRQTPKEDKKMAQAFLDCRSVPGARQTVQVEWVERTRAALTNEAHARPALCLGAWVHWYSVPGASSSGRQIMMGDGPNGHGRGGPAVYRALNACGFLWATLLWGSPPNCLFQTFPRHRSGPSFFAPRGRDTESSSSREAGLRHAGGNFNGVFLIGSVPGGPDTEA